MIIMAYQAVLARGPNRHQTNPFGYPSSFLGEHTFVCMQFVFLINISWLSERFSNAFIRTLIVLERCLDLTFFTLPFSHKSMCETQTKFKCEILHFDWIFVAYQCRTIMCGPQES